MLFKLSFRNMKKSLKDYAIYFLTLVLGVAIFYMFNSLDSQEAMLKLSDSTREMVELLISLLGMVSVFVAVILGLLIVYANNFLISRRKKEFGIYMTLGMGRRQISKIILLETILIGIVSLAVGLVIGIFASQFMSILVAKLFQADMSGFEFVFSSEACIKTCLYFAVMYLAVIIFNTISISRYKLIDLMTAAKKNEKIKIKNPVICIILFLLAVGMLAYAYYKVTAGATTLNSIEAMYPIILLGIVGTFLVFWSLSGFILRMVQARKKLYYKDANMFVLRQLNNKVNTNVISMTVICLMLFMTVTVLSSALSLRNTMEKDLAEMTPVDINLYKTANIPENNKDYSEAAKADSRITVRQTLENYGFDMNLLKDVVEVPIYTVDELTLANTLGSSFATAKQQFAMLTYDMPETIMKISDYNQIAQLYGQEQYTVNDNQYIMLCDFENMAEIRNQALAQNEPIQLLGKNYYPKYQECKSGYLYMSTSHTNTGIILVPDSCPLPESNKEQTFLAANFNAETDEEKEEIHSIFSDENSELVQKMREDEIYFSGLSKIEIMAASVGLATIIVFVAIYLGIIFLIASSAILALKQLTESSDNKQRYDILRKIGADEKMIHSALLKQIGIFFLIPLVFAIIHSIFGIQFVVIMMSGLASSEELVPSIIATVIVIGVVYGLYFWATYAGSKNVIKSEI